MEETTIILADGKFPGHPIPLGFLKKSQRVILCDGAARYLRTLRTEPLAIVGDCDSLPRGIGEKYQKKIFRIAEQETNDLTKAVLWCRERGLNNILILGATGKREDHTIGNISLLLEYGRLLKVKMITDTGVIMPVYQSSEFISFPGQEISFFTVESNTEITTEGLEYPLVKRKLTNWWQATLNRATGSSIRLIFNPGPLILFMGFGNKEWEKTIIQDL